ncbi:MAG: DUF885 domain-containing protein [Bacteriovoracaceae bacterium]|nr:DUF885 domain-containing protein [Bacteriovoracaceae bacterium]
MYHKILFSFLILLTSCSTLKDVEHTKQASENFHKILTEYSEESKKIFPIDATSFGDNQYNDYMPDYASKEYRESLKNFLEKYLGKIKKILFTHLSDEDQLSYEVFENELQRMLDELRLDLWKIPTQYKTILPILSELGSGTSYQPFQSVVDYRSWLKRVSVLEQWTNSAIDSFREGMKSHYVLQRSVTLKLVDHLNSMVVSNPADSIFYHPIKNMPPYFTKVERLTLEVEYRKTIEQKILPSYKKLATFLEQEYLPEARSSIGLSSLPGGEDYYRFLVKSWADKNTNPSEIYELGLKEVARIKSEMDKIKNQLKFEGDQQEFFIYLYTDPKFLPFKHTSEISNKFSLISKKIESEINSLFKVQPKAAYKMNVIESMNGSLVPPQYYPGSDDGSRSAIFHYPVVAKSFYLNDMESIFLREGIGRHYLGSLSKEESSFQKVQRFVFSPACFEGWPMYVSSLGKEVGLYSDPYQYMGSLYNEMLQSIYLVLDVAIHEKGMSREEAIKYMVDNRLISNEWAANEIDYLIENPANNLAYKFGAIKIRSLREKYEKSLGNKFNLADFHYEFLKDGCMPFPIMEKKLDLWAKKILHSK